MKECQESELNYIFGNGLDSSTENLNCKLEGPKGIKSHRSQVALVN